MKRVGNFLATGHGIKAVDSCVVRDNIQITECTTRVMCIACLGSSIGSDCRGFASQSGSWLSI